MWWGVERPTGSMAETWPSSHPTQLSRIQTRDNHSLLKPQLKKNRMHLLDEVNNLLAIDHAVHCWPRLIMTPLTSIAHRGGPPGTLRPPEASSCSFQGSNTTPYFYAWFSHLRMKLLKMSTMPNGRSPRVLSLRLELFLKNCFQSVLVNFGREKRMASNWKCSSREKSCDSHQLKKFHWSEQILCLFLRLLLVLTIGGVLRLCPTSTPSMNVQCFCRVNEHVWSSHEKSGVQLMSFWWSRTQAGAIFTEARDPAMENWTISGNGPFMNAGSR